MTVRPAWAWVRVSQRHGGASAHRMRHDIELQIRALQLRLELGDAPDEFACVADVVLAPVVRKDIERVLITIGARIVPIAVAITSVATQRHE